MKDMQSRRKIASVTKGLSNWPIRRHRDADEDQRGDGPGALTAEPRQSLGWNGHASLQRHGHVAFEWSASP